VSGDSGIVSKSDERAKQIVALSSVGAAVLLTGVKIATGFATGSLGILSEAAHSGLDLLAAIVTLFVVRVAGRPADRIHPYGYGKAENLGALSEVVILLVTCVWIIYEAVRRLTGAMVEVDANVFAFGVMFLSIAVDFTRSRALMRAAKRYDSQALQADALHFSTDILSSCVVIGGLTLVRLSSVFGVPGLARADAVAALGVAGIVIFVSLRLARAATSALLDVAPEGLADKISEAAARVEGVREVRQARVRKSGAATFVDLTIAVSRSAHFEHAHAIAETVANAVRSSVPRSDVVVHVDPLTDVNESLGDTVISAAVTRGLHAHGLRLHNVGGKSVLELHVEVPARLSLGEAHKLVTDFESAVRADLPWVSDVNSHIEPVEEARPTSTQAADVEAVRERVLAVALSRKIDVHKIEVYLADEEWHVSLHFVEPPETSVVDAHRESERLERALREAIPNLGRIVLHAEPPGDQASDEVS
jgi:cation diffusion facilitator family transporter